MNETIINSFLNRFIRPVLVPLFMMLVAAACADRATMQTETGAYEGTVLEGAAPEFQLVDQHERAVALSDFRGQVVVLTFLDSQCEEVCPLTAAHLRTAYDALDGDAQSVVFLGVNANVEANDVTEVAGATEKWQLSEIPNWRFLTGPADELEPVWEAHDVGVFPAEDEAGQLLHTPGVYLIDQRGQKRWYISTPFDESGKAQWTAPLSDVLVKQIKALLREE